MKFILCVIFFFSGVAALMFEILWFQLTGITFGNSVYASTVVLASFMGGLALGNGLAATKGSRITNPIRVYALIELAIAVSGFSIVLFLPALSEWIAPVFKPLSSRFIFINSLRMLISFLILLVPTTAMGATLPLLVSALYKSDHNYGKILGALYGWNTLGAVIGVLLCEFFLLEALGILGCGAVAASFNLLAAFLALRITGSDSNSINKKIVFPAKDCCNQQTLKLSPILLAICLAGFILLALEVIWFRFILLFFHSTSINFSVMLSVVLLGISVGGLAGSFLFKKNSDAQKLISYFFIANSVAISVLYANFGNILNIFQGSSLIVRLSLSSIFLMFPVCMISGIIYTLMGKLIFS